MPNSIGLATYAIRIKDRYEQEYLPVNEFGGRDLLDLFIEYLTDREAEASQDEEDERLLRVVSYEETDRTIAGIVETGEYGYEADLVDSTTGKTRDRRRRTDAEMLPFYFLLSVPEDHEEAVLILQRFRQFGVRGAMWSDFFYFIEPHRTDFTFQLNPIVPPGLLERVRRSEDVRSIRFIHHGLPPDIAEKLDPAIEIPEDQGILEVIIRPERGARFPKLGKVKDWWNADGHLPGAVELMGYEFEDVRVQLDVEGKKRTVNFSRPESIRPEYDITQVVGLDQTSGHPQFDSIDSIARDILEDVHHYLGIG